MEFPSARIMQIGTTAQNRLLMQKDLVKMSGGDKGDAAESFPECCGHPGDAASSLERSVDRGTMNIPDKGRGLADGRRTIHGEDFRS